MANSLSTNLNNVVFFGSGQFAAHVLTALLKVGYSFPVIITQRPQPAGRKGQLRPTAVEVLAQQQQLVVRYDWPEQSYHCTSGLVVDYGRIIPKHIEQLFSKGIINIHPSLLPRWRGASPIPAAILANDATTGVSVMRIAAGVDAGPLLGQRQLPLTVLSTTVELTTRLADLGAELYHSIIGLYLTNAAEPIPQDTTAVTYCSKLTKAIGHISANDSHSEIWRKYRALNPWPGIFCFWQGKRIRLLDMTWNDTTNQLTIQQVQPEGKNPMSFKAFLAGHAGFSLDNIEV